MKKRHTVFFGLAAMALAFVLAGCPDGGGSSGSSDPAYSGKFTMDDGTDVLFELDNAGSSSASLSIVGGRSRAAAGSTSITGKLKDPSGVRQLRGTYDRASGAFEVSADGTNSRYRISGTFDSNKQVLAANALVDNKTNTATRLTMSVVVPRSGAIGGGGAEMAETLPNEFWGTWSMLDTATPSDDWEGPLKMVVLFSPYTLYDFETSTVEKSESGSGVVNWRNEVPGGVLVRIDQVSSADTATYPGGYYYNAIFVIPGGLEDNLDADARNEVNTLFEDYLESIGIIDAVRVTPDFDDGPDWNAWAADTTTKQYYIDKNGGIHCHNFTVGQDWLTLLNRWRSANPTSKYMKFKLWIDGAALKIHLYAGGTTQNDVVAAFDSLTDAQNVATHNQQIVLPLTR